MVDKEAIRQRAREWAEKNVPSECPNEHCDAVNRWQIGEVRQVNKARYNILEGHAEAAPDDPGPDYIVALTCGKCGRDFFHYEEEKPRGE